MIRRTPLRRITLHFSQIGFTDALTFIFIPHSSCSWSSLLALSGSYCPICTGI